MKKCKHCGKELINKDYRAKFCNHSCAASFNNKKLDVPKRFCNVCDSALKLSQRKYCSSGCESVGIWKETERKIESGLRTSIGSIRKYLFKTRNNICEICKGSEWFGNPMPLVMDHINGDPTDHRIDNLRLICPNCDRFTPTFGSRNRGFGRHSRGIKRGSY